MRAATTLIPLLQAAGTGAGAMPDIAGIANIWRGDEWMHADPQADCISSGFRALDAELPGLGWPRGQLVELLADCAGIGELSLLLPALAAVTRAGRSCVWVLPCPAAHADAPDATTPALPYAPALAEAGMDLARNIFVRPLTTRESGWALEQSLRAAHLGALIGWLPQGAGADADFRSLRRLHLLAQRHQALVFVLRSAGHARAPSPAVLRLHLQPADGLLQVRLLKRRGRPLLDPVAIQIHPARWNRTPVPNPVCVPVPAAATAARDTSPLRRMVQALAPGARLATAALGGTYAPCPST
jgi:protein ImuA